MKDILPYLNSPSRNHSTADFSAMPASVGYQKWNWHTAFRNGYLYTTSTRVTQMFSTCAHAVRLRAGLQGQRVEQQIDTWHKPGLEMAKLFPRACSESEGLAAWQAQGTTPRTKEASSMPRPHRKLWGQVKPGATRFASFTRKRWGSDTDVRVPKLAQPLCHHQEGSHGHLQPWQTLQYHPRSHHPTFWPTPGQN